jgi:DNA-binding transcriptional ArsR family regulator
MKDGPNIARIASLLGDPARADVLTALLADRALTATELASIAGVTKQTMSAHLSKLLDAGLVAVAQQGRHRYFRLADQDVAALLESLMGVAFRTGAVRLLSSPREPALRKARVCYDHLAGESGVAAFEALSRLGAFEVSRAELRLSKSGVDWFERFGIDTDAAARRHRTFCRPCMDWSERRHHLAGALGAALLSRLYALKWAARDKNSRVIRFTASGQRAFQDLLQASTVGHPIPAFGRKANATTTAAINSANDSA